MRLLLAEDERFLAKAIVKILEKNHYSVDVVYDGEEALDYLRHGNYDVAILDIMMPKMDGITVLQTIRREKNRIPILLLSAKSQTEDKVLGLDSGANDYLTKPFETEELLARLRAMTRSSAQVDVCMHFGNVELNCATYEIRVGEESIRLANKEFQIMEFLMSNPQNLFTPEFLLEKIWGYDSEVEINVVWVYISYLRKKLGTIGADIQIKSYRNAGYSLEGLS